jgi:hypothetical protein
MKAFANHFRVEDSKSTHMQTYDNGVASIFEVPTTDSTDVLVNYIGILKDILKLDYGPLHAPVILLRCEWFRQEDNRGNSTYKWDEVGFLVANSHHKLPRLFNPFIFSSQVTQVFFSDITNKRGWKVVMRKEAQSEREELDTSDVFISTTHESFGLIAPDEAPAPPKKPSLVWAIELSKANNLLEIAKF